MFNSIMQSAALFLESFLATKYLTAASLTILIYDHLLLLGREIKCIWEADSSWFKWLFLYNHYSVPIYNIISGLALGLLPGNFSPQPEFCKRWLAVTPILPISSLAIVNIFVAQRIYILWGLNKKVLKLVCFSVIVTYAFCFILSVIGVVQSSRYIVYDPILKTCVPQRISELITIGFGFPLVLELMNFILLCCNALHRPRHLQTYIIKQLYLDGVLYFMGITVLRVANVLALSGALSQENRLLFPFLLWSMIPVIVHRMILTLNDNLDAESNENKIAAEYYSGLYVKGVWFSPSINPNPIHLRTGSADSSHFGVLEETYIVSDLRF